MPSKIRRAELVDAPAIAGCLAELGYETQNGLVESKLAELGDSTADAVFVAEDTLDSRVLGVISVHVIPLFHSVGNAARITALVVTQAARRMGVGRGLVEVAERFAWSRGCRRIEVTSGDHRLAAHAFYEAVGYSQDERRFLKHVGSER